MTTAGVQVSTRLRRSRRPAVTLAAAALLGAACDREILVGTESPGITADDGAPPTDASKAVEAGAATEAGASDTGESDGGTPDGGLAPLVVPWSTGFENGFGDWSQPANEGACYVEGNATYAIVTSPVHSGQYAAAFTVNTAANSPSQTRCYREGVLPAVGYYGAWYYVPAPATSVGNWNLFHFQGAFAPDGGVTELWDVSLANQPDGAVAPTVYDFARARQLNAGPPIPIGAWFHLEVRLNRSASSGGELTVYVNGATVLDLSRLETDSTRWGQWFVGDYATALLPSPYTVYVDDVTIDTIGP